MPKLIDQWIKKAIYKAYKKDHKKIDEIVDEYKVNKRTVYMIVKKLSNEESIQNLKSSWSEKSWSESPLKKNIENNNIEPISESWKENLNENNINEKNEEKFEEKNDKNELFIENKNETNYNDNEENNNWRHEDENKWEEKEKITNWELIDFLSKNVCQEKKIIEEPIQPQINTCPLTIKKVKFDDDELPQNNNEEKENEIENKKTRLKKNNLKKNILFESDIDIVTWNNIDLTNKNKNDIIIKIRKYYLYFEDDLKCVLDKRKLNNLFKLEYDELNCIYQLIQ